MLRNAVYKAVAVLVFATAIHALTQCHVGKKLYSVEFGKVVCAPFVAYPCIEACEWNTNCSLTSHWAAFAGRRSYVSGMILTNGTFLQQCCASLATITQMNEQQEPLCIWTQQMKTVEDHGSVRLDPPLAQNEYIREITLERQARGAVSLRAQICKFAKQRTNCDKKSIPPEDWHLYTLLLLRLSRTQLLLNNVKDRNKADIISSVANSARLRLQNRLRLQDTAEPQDVPPTTATTEATSTELTTTAIPTTTTTSLITSEASTPEADTSPRSTIPPPVIRRLHRDPPVQSPNSIVSGVAHHTGSKNAAAAMAPRTSAALQVPPRVATRFGSVHVGGHDFPRNNTVNARQAAAAAIVVPEVRVPFDESPHFLARPSASALPRPNTLRRVDRLTSVPHLGVYRNQTVARHSTNYSREIAVVQPPQRITVPTSASLQRDAIDVEERPIKSGLQIQKLQNGHTRLAQASFGGSFDSRAEPAGTSLPKAPPFKIIPISKQFPSSGQTGFRQQTSQPYILRHTSPKDAARLGLIECCQAQAPGCKQLCSGDVGKDQIRNALSSQQCPPLSMTSVIQCFPRFYNTTPVADCCARQARSPWSAGLSSTDKPLPPQCLALCSPNFKLSFSHFACIDHISTIVECYRDLTR